MNAPVESEFFEIAGLGYTHVSYDWKKIKHGNLTKTVCNLYLKNRMKFIR